ncbi:MAG: hypothetical protein IPL33_06450 [Sphingobacteriales bacterium]|nr:hypothetical protein [Sphingobacteriales bacterium]
MRRPDFRIRAIADISVRHQRLDTRYYPRHHHRRCRNGYNPHTEQEEAPYQAHTIDIMSVDNLTQRTARDASHVRWCPVPMGCA